MKYILEVDGMHCGMCEAHVNDIVRRTGLCKKVKSSHKKSNTIVITKEEIDIERVKDAIISLGYKVGNIVKED